jgi:hypothetical protein
MHASQHVCVPAIADPVDMFLSQPHCLAALSLARIRKAQAPVPLQLVVFSRRRCGCRVKIVTAFEPVTQLASPRVLRTSPAREHCVTQINNLARVSKMLPSYVRSVNVGLHLYRIRETYLLMHVPPTAEATERSLSPRRDVPFTDVMMSPT